MAIDFRLAMAGDADRLSALTRDAKASWGYPASWLAEWEASLRISESYITRETVWIGVIDGEIAGFYALERNHEGLRLAHLWVAPRMHRRGIGRHLLAHAVGQARLRRARVLLIEADPNAAGFYTRMGGREIGRVPAPMDDAPERSLPVFEITVPGDLP